MTASRGSTVIHPTVLLVCPVAEVGGAEQVTLAIARGLTAGGFRSVLAIMRPGPLTAVARAQGIETFEFPTPHRYRDLPTVVSGIRWLADVARRSQTEIFHSTHTAHLYAGPAARWLRVPEVWHHHDTPTPGFDLVQAMNRWLPTRHAIFTTRTVADAHPWLARGPHSIVPPVCVDLSVLTTQPDQPDVLARLNIPRGDLLLTVARLQAHKGHADLLDAAAAVLLSHPSAVFVIAGKASDPEQARNLATLRAQVDRLKIASRVAFTGFVSDADLAALYRRATALVHPARSEGYGLVLLEAMGMGVPVVSAAAAGPREFIIDGYNGLLVPVADPTALAAAIARVLADPDLRRDLAAAGRETSAALTSRTTIDQMIAVFRTLVPQS